MIQISSLRKSIEPILVGKKKFFSKYFDITRNSELTRNFQINTVILYKNIMNND